MNRREFLWVCAAATIAVVAVPALLTTARKSSPSIEDKGTHIVLRGGWDTSVHDLVFEKPVLLVDCHGLTLYRCVFEQGIIVWPRWFDLVIADSILYQPSCAFYLSNVGLALDRLPA